MLALKNPGGCMAVRGWWLLGEIKGYLCIIASGSLEMSKPRHRGVKQLTQSLTLLVAEPELQPHL